MQSSNDREVASSRVMLLLGLRLFFPLPGNFIVLILLTGYDCMTLPWVQYIGWLYFHMLLLFMKVVNSRFWVWLETPYRLPAASQGTDLGSGSNAWRLTCSRICTDLRPLLTPHQLFAWVKSQSGLCRNHVCPLMWWDRRSGPQPACCSLLRCDLFMGNLWSHKFSSGESARRGFAGVLDNLSPASWADVEACSSMSFQSCLS